MTEEEQKLYDEGEKIAKAEDMKDSTLKYQLQLKALTAFYNNSSMQDKEYVKHVKQLEKDRIESEHSDNATRLSELDDMNKKMRSMNDDKYAAEILANDAEIAQIRASKNLDRKAEIDDDYKQSQEKKKIRDMELSGASHLAGDLLTIGKAFGSEGFEFTKQVSAAQAVINSLQAYTLAIATYPPPYGEIIGGVSLAAGLAQVAVIESTHLATGIDSVPGIGFGDSVPAMLTPGEGVVDAGTNKDLKNFFSGGGSNAMKTGLDRIAMKIDALAGAIMQNPTKVSIDGKVLVDVLRNQSRLGRKAFA